MYSIIPALISGLLVAPRLPSLPESMTIGLLFVVVLLMFAMNKSWWVASGLLGVCYGCWVGLNWQASNLDQALEGDLITVSGYVDSLPSRTDYGLRFEFVVEHSEPDAHIERLVLNWSGDPHLGPKAGETWRFHTRLLRPYGSVNQGLFDYEGWLLSQGISAKGYIIKANRLRHHQAPLWLVWHQQLREHIRHRVEIHLPNNEIRGLLLALMLGASEHISPRVWQALSATGTNHLLVISGLHVGMVAGLIFALSSTLFKRLTRQWRLVAVIVSLALTIFYGLVAGFGLPVQRSLIMAGLAMLTLVWHRVNAVWLIFCYAMLLTLVMNPYASLNAGFWLSFGAVAALILGLTGRSVTSRSTVLLFLRTQWVAFIAMPPLLICWVYQVSLISFIANSLAIPLVTLVIVPILLVTQFLLLLPIFEIQHFMLELASLTITLLLHLIDQLAALDWVFHRVEHNKLYLLLGLLASLTLICPKGLLPRWLAACLALPLLIGSKTDFEGKMLLTVMDVGQGLTALITTDEATILYDTGPAFSRFNAGTHIVLPTIRGLQRNMIDLLVVSHSDLDHAGGFQAITTNMLVKKKISSNARYGESCAAGKQWRVGDVKIKAYTATLDKGINDKSCVLLVEHTTGTLLLPGDIEIGAELQLLNAALPAIDVMIAPHHGSISSSTPAFINHIDPGLVVFSAGYKHRFGHPHPRVVERYRNRKIVTLNTAESGAVTVLFDQAELSVTQARQAYPRFWYD